jgi:hypothetical protein
MYAKHRCPAHFTRPAFLYKPELLQKWKITFTGNEVIPSAGKCYKFFTLGSALY